MEFESDWAFLRAVLPELQDYLLSNDVYRPLSATAETPGSRQTPQLTLGSVLLSQARLAAGDLDPTRQDEFNRLALQIQQTRDAWSSNWSRKAAKEFASRLNLWRQYLQELRADQRGYLAYFPTEVRHRAILHLLQPEILGSLAVDEKHDLDLLDAVLRQLSQPGLFVWKTDVMKSFPPDEFWFLYLRIKSL